MFFIADEVVCGFEQVGAPFVSYLYGIRQDLITIAKGMTSDYLELCGVIICKRVWKVGAIVSAACLEQNLMAPAMPDGDILGFAPSLRITKKEVDDIVTRSTKALNSVVDQLTKKYSWKD